VNDSVFRIAAVAAAAALLAAPYWAQIKAAACRALEAAKAQAGLFCRIAAAALLIAAAWGKVPLPTLPAAVPQVSVETPSADMQRLVADVAAALRDMPAGDRMLWASVWKKAGVVVAGDAVTAQTAFTDTRSLQAYTALAMDIAWRRVGGHKPGSNEQLRQAVEAAYAATMGRDVVPVTADVRARYVALAEAIAWAGLNRG
jgi:hypothetical protein